MSTHLTLACRFARFNCKLLGPRTVGSRGPAYLWLPLGGIWYFRGSFGLSHVDLEKYPKHSQIQIQLYGTMTQRPSPEFCLRFARLSTHLHSREASFFAFLAFE